MSVPFPVISVQINILVPHFSQALNEPMYCRAYANLCKVMSTIKVEQLPSEEGGKAKILTFRRVLLTKFQQEFEKDKRDDEERETMLSAIKEIDDVSDNGTRKYNCNIQS